MNSDDSNTSGDDRAWEPSERRSKRIKIYPGRAHPSRDFTKPSLNTTGISLDALLNIPLLEIKDFEDILPRDNYLAARTKYLRDNSESDPYHSRFRPLTLPELQELRVWFENTAASGRQTWTVGEAILSRRLKLRKLKNSENAAFSYDVLRQEHTHSSQRQTLSLPSSPPSHSSPHEETLDALYTIRKTPYVSSFASRLLGGYTTCNHPYLVHRDWETQAPWMDLLSDIRLHYSISHPNDETLEEVTSPIDYVSLQRVHLPQIHDMLSRIFWPAIDVSDSLRYSPTRCTVVATYKHLVVGAAFLSSPEETYLTYLVVRPGWENANIASVMLYHLIAANPKKDITLHVSANNPAMLLYNKFGFKAEEFIVGFYEDYLPKESKACKNAFRLRLRR